jgi:hypothetical protein
VARWDGEARQFVQQTVTGFVPAAWPIGCPPPATAHEPPDGVPTLVRRTPFAEPADISQLFPSSGTEPRLAWQSLAVKYWTVGVHVPWSVTLQVHAVQVRPSVIER